MAAGAFTAARSWARLGLALFPVGGLITGGLIAGLPVGALVSGLPVAGFLIAGGAFRGTGCIRNALGSRGRVAGIIAVRRTLQVADARLQLIHHAQVVRVPHHA